MGMRGHLRQITPAELSDLQRNPKNVKKLVHGKTRRNRLRLWTTMIRLQKVATEARSMNLSPEEQEKVRAGIIKELQAAGVNLEGGSDGNGLNLEKSWHVLHYLLTGKPEEAPPPLGNAILGGKEIGPDLGYGPARFLDPDEVRDVASALSTITSDDLAQRFDLQTMIAANIYPLREESELQMAQEYFPHLSRYYSEAAAAGNAMLLYVI
jgi:hypothetical protein